jgi:hypothetical protein
MPDSSKTALLMRGVYLELVAALRDHSRSRLIARVHQTAAVVGAFSDET